MLDGSVGTLSKLISVAVAAAALTLGLVPGAATPDVHAFEACRKPVSIIGPAVRGERSAMTAATAAWQREARRLHGRRFANWWYSGDRTLACTWDRHGVIYRCRATALPCR